GFELTFFRFALEPPPAAPPSAPRSAWRSREVWMAHFAVTDVAAQRFRAAQKLSRAALALAGGEAGPARAWVRCLTLAAAPGGGWKLRASQDGYAIELTLEAGTPVLNGDAGFSRKAAEPGAASYYYSVPRLRAHGQLLRGGQTLAVNGLAWLDREWG